MVQTQDTMFLKTKHFKDNENVQLVQFGASDGSEAYTMIISLLKKGEEAYKFFPIKAYDIDKDIFKASCSGLLNLNRNDISAMSDEDFKKCLIFFDFKMIAQNI